MGGQQSVLSHLFSQSHHIVMLGLDGAGKTTVLYQLKFDRYTNTVPTVGFNCEKVKGQLGKSKGAAFTVWDVGGQDKLRPLWSTYMRHTEGIIFVVDSVDFERFEEARIELHRTAKNGDTLGVPILVIANKQDLPEARTREELERSLSLGEIGDTHPWAIQEACGVIGDGLFESIETLHEMILQRKKKGKGVKSKK